MSKTGLTSIATEKGLLGLIPLDQLSEDELRTAGQDLAQVVSNNPRLEEHAPIVDRYRTADDATRRLSVVQANLGSGFSAYLIAAVMYDTVTAAYGIATEIERPPGIEKRRVKKFTDEQRKRYEKLGKNLTFWCTETPAVFSFPDNAMARTKGLPYLVAGIMSLNLKGNTQREERYTLLRTDGGLSKDPAAAFLEISWRRTGMIGRSALLEGKSVEIVAN